MLKLNAFRVLINFTVEHILNLIAILHYTTTCFRQDDTIEAFFKSQLSEIFYFIPYSPWYAFIGKLTNVFATFCWSFMDLFVMIISIGLSSRFKQINEDLQRIKGQVSKNMCVKFRM